MKRFLNNSMFHKTLAVLAVLLGTMAFISPREADAGYPFSIHYSRGYHGYRGAYSPYRHSYYHGRFPSHGHYHWHDTSHYDWHDTSHWDRIGNRYYFHRDGHWDFHPQGHWDYHGHHH